MSSSSACISSLIVLGGQRGHDSWVQDPSGVCDLPIKKIKSWQSSEDAIFKNEPKETHLSVKWWLELKIHQKIQVASSWNWSWTELPYVYQVVKQIAIRYSSL